MARSRGFTLLELVVALTLAGFVALAAHRIFTGVLDGVRRVEAARGTLDREANARRLLAALVAGVAVSRGPPDAFEGGRDRVTFSTWHVDALGRTVRRRVRLALEGEALVAHGLGPDAVRLLGDVTEVAFDYLLALGAAERFVREWYSDASPPAAMRMRIARGAATDTLLLIIGSRG